MRCKIDMPPAECWNQWWIQRLSMEFEAISKNDLFFGLRAATAECPNGEYSKGGHSFQILARIDAAMVSAASPWCARFLAALDRLCT
jgi:hypothetical protein